MFSKRFLYRFRCPCRFIDKPAALTIGENYKLPDLSVLDKNASGTAATVEKKPVKEFIEVRAGWHHTGLLFTFIVTGKKQPPWCRSALPEDSDGIQLFIDTRNIKDIHRASRFCHRILVMPADSAGNNSPQVIWLPIARAKEHPKAIEVKKIHAESILKKDGYQLHVFIPGNVLTGYDPTEYADIGFHYAVTDREFGNVYFAAEPPLPVDNDPSLWTTLCLNQD